MLTSRLGVGAVVIAFVAGLACKPRSTARVKDDEEEAPADEDTSEVGAVSLPSISKQNAFKNLSFVQPTALVQRPADNSRFFLLEKPGRIVSFPNNPDAGAGDVQTAIDLKDVVASGDADKVTFEEGLLNLVFAPGFSQRGGEAYVYYTTGADQKNLFVRLSKFVSPDGLRFDPASERILLQVKKDRGNHNGGGMLFGRDGFLYLGIGDGGVPNDPNRNAQNKKALLGKVLRLDIVGRRGSEGVTRAEADRLVALSTEPDKTKREISGRGGYVIPATNPFADGSKGRAEIFSYGHRNPWRMAQHPTTAQIFEAEVGQDAVEEVNVLQLGKNFGWSAFEGSSNGPNFNAGTGADQPVFPVAEYGRDVGGSITGGFVYRGKDPKAATLVGKYVFGEFNEGTISVLEPAAGGKFKVIKLGDTAIKATSFGEDQDGNLFVLDFIDGHVYKLIPGAPVDIDDKAVRTHFFLSRDGVGTTAKTLDYYKQTGADVETPTLTDFNQKFIAASGFGTFKSLYRNVGDLGFWRDMTCSTQIVAGAGGCSVTNWKDENDKADFEAAVAAGQAPDAGGFVTASGGRKIRNLGTVSMNIAPEGFTRFYVFGSNLKLSPVAVLDAEGEKNPPQLCTPCHGGRYSGAAPQIGSIFREFEPSWLQPRHRGGNADSDQDAAEKDWFQMNQIIKTANDALIAKNPGADVADAADKTNDYIDRLYAGVNPNKVRGKSIYDPATIPASWTRAEANPLLTGVKQEMWTKVVAPYCMQCHRTNTEDFTEYSSFSKLVGNDKDLSQLERHIGLTATEFDLLKPETTDQEKKNRLKVRGAQVMPQAIQTWKLLFAGNPLLSTADRLRLNPLKAIEKFVTQGERSEPHIKVRFRLTATKARGNGQVRTATGEDIYLVGSLKQLGLEGDATKKGLARAPNEFWNAVNGVRLAARDAGNGRLEWSGFAYLPAGAKFRWRAAIKTKVGEQYRIQCGNGLGAKTVTGEDGRAFTTNDAVAEIKVPRNADDAVQDVTFFDAQFEDAFHDWGATGQFGCN